MIRLSRFLFVASLIASAVGVEAQALRRNDFISLVDRVRCTEPHYRGASSGLVPDGKGALATHVAGTVESIDRDALDERGWDGLGEFRLNLTTLEPCSDAWMMQFDFVAANAGQRGASIQGLTRGLPFGHRGEFGHESLGSIWGYIGASTSRRLAYDPALDLTRDAWMGTTVQLGIPAKVWLPKIGTGRVVFTTFASLQGDYAWDADVRATRGDKLVPHWNVSLPIAVMRALPIPRTRGELPIVGLTYAFDRIEDFAAAGALQRQVLAITTRWLGGHLALTIHRSVEALGGRSIYREIGLTLEPTRCTQCQITF